MRLYTYVRRHVCPCVYVTVAKAPNERQDERRASVVGVVVHPIPLNWQVCKVRIHCGANSTPGARTLRFGCMDGFGGERTVASPGALPTTTPPKQGAEQRRRRRRRCQRRRLSNQICDRLISQTSAPTRLLASAPFGRKHARTRLLHTAPAVALIIALLLMMLLLRITITIVCVILGRTQGNRQMGRGRGEGSGVVTTEQPSNNIIAATRAVGANRHHHHHRRRPR